MNKTAAKEWLVIAYHDLKSAQILYDAQHYTDSIGNDLQQAMEKSLKACIAYKNSKIPRSHDLFELYKMVEILQITDQEIEYLYLATEYFKEDHYPYPNYALPLREEIKEVMEFAYKIFDTVCEKLQIDKREIDVR